MNIPAIRANFAPTVTPLPGRDVILLLNSLGIGGSEAKSIRMANSLAQRGVKVSIAYLNPPESLRGEVAPDVELVHLARQGKFSWRALRSLTEAIRSRRSPVVVTYNLYPALYGALARLRLGRSSFRLLASINTTDVMTGSVARRMPLYRWALRQADTIVFGAEAQRAVWRQRYGIGRKETTEVLYNGVNTHWFEVMAGSAEAHPRPPRTQYVIGSVGRMRPEKAHVSLVTATAELRARGLDVGALIVGDGPERARILAEIARLRLQEVVVLTGEMRDVRPYLAAMDVFVLPSIAVETFSNAALEAMACGVPVVCSRIGGMEELIAFGGGVSYAAGDTGQLTDVLCGLLRDDRERHRLARDARRAAVEHFGWDRMVERFLELAAGQ